MSTPDTTPSSGCPTTAIATSSLAIYAIPWRHKAKRATLRRFRQRTAFLRSPVARSWYVRKYRFLAVLPHLTLTSRTSSSVTWNEAARTPGWIDVKIGKVRTISNSCCSRCGPVRSVRQVLMCLKVVVRSHLTVTVNFYSNQTRWHV